MNFHYISYADTILGIDKKSFIVIVAICLLLALLMTYFYIAITFVNKNSVKIVERFSKYKKTLEPGIHIIVPFIDKVVGVINTSQSILVCEKEITFFANDKRIDANYSIVYSIVAPSDYFYSSNDIKGLIEVHVSKVLSSYFADVKIKSSKNLYSLVSERLISMLNEECKEVGIKITDLVFMNIKE